MKINEIASEALRKTYRITIEAAEINAATEAELKALSSKVKIPGFRPGFVPLKVMQQRYGKNVQGDVLKSVINDATERTLRDNKLRIATQPDVKLEGDYSEDKDLVFTLTVDTMPEIPEIDFSKLQIEREVFDVEDAAVDDAMQLVAKANPVSVVLDAKAKAESGNVLTVDFKGMVDGVAFEGGTAENFKIEIGSGRLIPGFEDQLIGTKVGDEKDVKVTFPENYFSTELAGKKAVFEVKVKEIARLDAPQLDDEFAKARGMKDLAALREGVREQIGREYGEIVRTRLKKRLFDALEGLCDYPLPQSMTKMEFDAIWSRLQQAAESDPEVYEGKPEAEVKAEYERIAERRVKLGILLAEIGQRQKIQATREELTRAVMSHASQFPGQEKMVFEYYRKNPARLDELRGPILEEKAVDFILSQVKLLDTKVSTKELAEAGPEDAMAPSAPKKKAKKSDESDAKAAPKKKSSAKQKSSEDGND